MPNIFRLLAICGVAAFSAACGGGGEAPPDDPCLRCADSASCAPDGASCVCPQGYSGDGTSAGTGCTNIDECSTGAANCAEASTCLDTEGSFSCACIAGYSGDGTKAGTGCADIDECSDAAANPCGSASLCANTVGAFECRGLFAPTSFTNHVYRLDPATLEVLETLDPVLDGEAISGANSFGEDPTDGTLFAILKVAGTRRLASFDAMTITYTQVAPLADRFSSLAFDDGGQLFAVTGDGASVRETLYRLDKVTGEATLEVALGNGADGEVIQFNPDDGQLYHWSGGTCVYEAISMDGSHTITPLSSSYNREVFGARWDASAHDFLVFDINSAARHFSTDGTFAATDFFAGFPDDLRTPGTTVAPPHLLQPVVGDVAGGVEVTLVGSGFGILGAATTVTFGADSVVGTVVDDHHITAVTPAGAAGTVDVSIIAGAYQFRWPQGFTYTEMLPAAVAARTRAASPATDPQAELEEPVAGCRVASRGGGELLLLCAMAAVLLGRRPRRR